MERPRFTTSIFQADAGGVSPITLSDAVNIDNNDLVVNLAGFSFPANGAITLFDAHRLEFLVSLPTSQSPAATCQDCT